MRHPPLTWVIAVDVTNRRVESGAFIVSEYRVITLLAVTEQEAKLVACRWVASSSPAEHMVIAARVLDCAA